MSNIFKLRPTHFSREGEKFLRPSWLRAGFYPLTTTRAIIMAQVVLAITRQLLQLEKCSNPLRIQQV